LRAYSMFLFLHPKPRTQLAEPGATALCRSMVIGNCCGRNKQWVFVWTVTNCCD